MIDFNTFDECLKAMEHDNEYFEQCNDVGLLLFEYIESDGMLCTLLGDLMCDDSDLIGWWCYEKDFGKAKDCFVKVGEETIVLDNTRKLYDFLIARKVEE